MKPRDEDQSSAETFDVPVTQADKDSVETTRRTHTESSNVKGQVMTERQIMDAFRQCIFSPVVVSIVFSSRDSATGMTTMAMTIAVFGILLPLMALVILQFCTMYCLGTFL